MNFKFPRKVLDNYDCVCNYFLVPVGQISILPSVMLLYTGKTKSPAKSATRLVSPRNFSNPSDATCYIVYFIQ